MNYISGLLTIAMVIGLLSCEKKEEVYEPVASFSVNPTKGTVSTIFIFDASDSYTESDLQDTLKVRWDWDGDLMFDTEYSTAMVREHRFDNPDIYKVVMEVSNTDGWSSRYSTVIEIFADSVQPYAYFSVTPDSSCVNTIFYFNAASSCNQNIPLTELQFRWDWNNDGIWDTPYMPDTSIYHKYTEFGNFRILLEVKNSVALTDTTSRKIFVYDI